MGGNSQGQNLLFCPAEGLLATGVPALASLPRAASQHVWRAALDYLSRAHPWTIGDSMGNRGAFRASSASNQSSVPNT